MSISYEQEIKIKNFVTSLKNKGKIYGTIYITITDDGYMVDDKPNIKDIEQISEEIGKMNGIDLSEYITEEQSEELLEYYSSLKEEEL